MTDDRRERYAAAIQRRVVPAYTLTSILPEVYEAADAAMAIADAELREVLGDDYQQILGLDAENARLRAELDVVKGDREHVTQHVYAETEDNARLRAENARLRAALRERISRDYYRVSPPLVFPWNLDGQGDDGHNPLVKDHVANCDQCKPAAREHVGNGANAEDCPACRGTNPDYPFICPGPASERRP